MWELVCCFAYAGLLCLAIVAFHDWVGLAGFCLFVLIGRVSFSLFVCVCFVMTSGLLLLLIEFVMVFVTECVC